MAGETSTTTTSATSRWRCPRTLLRLAPSTRLQPRRRGALRAHRVGGLHARPGRCGRPRSRAACEPPAAGRRRAWPRSRCASCSATSRARASWLAADGPPGGYDWFARLARDPGHDQRVPVVLVHCSATCTRTCSRCRSRCSRSRSRCRSRSTGRAATPARRAVAEALAAGARASARSTRSTRGPIPVAAGLLVGAVRRLDARPAARRAARRSAPSGPCSCSWPGVVLVLPFWLNFDPAARGIGAVTERALVRALGRRHGADLRRARLGRAGRLRRAAARRARGRVRIAAWIGVGAAFVLSLLAPVDLSGIAVLLAALAVALHAALRAPARAARALPLAAGRAAGSRACSRPSSSTSATSSTAARCTA